MTQENATISRKYYFHDIGKSGIENIEKTITQQVKPSSIPGILKANNFWGFPTSDKSEEIYKELSVGDIVFLADIPEVGNGKILYACTVTFVNNRKTVDERAAIAEELWGDSKYSCLFSCKPTKLNNLDTQQFKLLTGYEHKVPGCIIKFEPSLSMEGLIKTFAL